ncbi:MAG: tRNA (guanosine(37)-N1)-methyltransferase TrmD [Mariprofundales bacterium]
MFHAQILTIFPEFFASPLACSIPARAIRDQRCQIDCINIRDFCLDKHRQVDDSPYGGGPGMVMKPEPVVAAIRQARSNRPGTRVIMLSPDGQLLTQARAYDISELSDITLLCGRYEGIDARVEHYIDDKLSLGPFVLSGGEPAALAVLDAIIRLLPGALGNAESAVQESFRIAPPTGSDDPHLQPNQPQIDWPHYTRPLQFEGLSVPEVLRSGDHAAINTWRLAQSQQRSEHYINQNCGKDSNNKR